jgi:hypothetical protein
MNEIKIGIPLHGKMAARAFHQPLFRERLQQGGLKPRYFLSPVYYRTFDFDPEQYFELQTEAYDALHNKSFGLQQLKLLRRFVVITETTDLRFRETIEAKLFNSSAWELAASLVYIDTVRHIPNVGHLLEWLEKQFYPTQIHTKLIRDLGLDCVLTPGMGNYNFYNEGSFALEAQRLGLPAFAAITNYDNIVNMGYRGFTPTSLAVWSPQMADEIVKLHNFPAKKVEITGAAQYDRFMQPLPLSREEFLRSLKLDPNKKTIFFAGGININHYFEIYRLFVEEKNRIWKEPFNFIVRPVPHAKLLMSPAWLLLEKILTQAGIYVSNPGSVDASGDRKDELRLDLALDEGPDELNYLLRYSDVLVNIFSTMGLEAAICDLPTIHIGYDAYTFGMRFSVTTAFQQRMTHNRRKLRLAASKVAKSETELLSFLDLYLSDHSVDHEARHEYAISECGELDGLAGYRLIEMIKNRI